MKNILFFTLLLIISTTLQLTAQVQIAQKIVGEATGDLSGHSVSMPDAQTVAVGAIYNDGNGYRSGHVRVYELVNNSWVQKGADIDGEAAGDESGFSVHMLDANTISIGTPFNNNDNGHVRIYRWNGSTWVQKGLDIDAVTLLEGAGFSIFMADSNTIAVGSPGGTISNIRPGFVRIFTWNGSSWIQKGGFITGDATGDRFGGSISMPDSRTIAIGAPLNDSNGTDAGRTKIFQWNGAAWIQKGLSIDGESTGDLSGIVSMPDTNTVAIGAIRNNGNGIDAGHVRIFKWNGTSWVQKGIDIDGEAAGDYSGTLSMPDSNTIAIGAYQNDVNGAKAGQVRIFKWNGTSWVQKGSSYYGEGQGDYFGRAVSMPDSNTFAAGAIESSAINSNDSGYVKVFSLCSTDTLFSVNVCGSYLSPSGKYTWSAVGTYRDTIPNLGGCDSLLTIIISTLVPLNNTINNFSPTLISNEFNAGYQWVDCDSNYTPIFGANNQIFTPTKSGNYAVVLSKNGCKDTSACENITLVGISENTVLNSSQIYPNPTNGVFTINFGINAQGVNLKVNSIDGKLIFQSNAISAKQYRVDLSNHPQGVYFITLQNKEEVKIIKLVKN